MRGGLPANETAIRSTMPATEIHEDQLRFVDLAMEEFKALHSGNAIRFGLRPLEFAAWLERDSERG